MNFPHTLVGWLGHVLMDVAATVVVYQEAPVVESVAQWSYLTAVMIVICVLV